MHHSAAAADLDPVRLRELATRLATRVAERFPQAGLWAVSLAVVSSCDEAADAGPGKRARWLRSAVVALSCVVFGLGAVITVWVLRQRSEAVNWSDLMQGLDASLNSVIVAAGGLYFLATLERKVARRHRLRKVHRLRALAYVIDLHQLNKDPERIVLHGPKTASSPESGLTPFLMARYLDYSSELLSVIGCLAATYAKNDDDEVVLEAVDAVSALTASISSKIWQKLLALDLLALAAYSGHRDHRDRSS